MKTVLKYWWIGLIVAAYVIISAVRGQWNPIDWFQDKPLPPAGPTPGTGCTAPGGQAGMYDTNGSCIPTASGGGAPIVERVIIATAPRSLVVSTGTTTPFMKYGCTYGNPRYYRMGWIVVYKISCP